MCLFAKGVQPEVELTEDEQAIKAYLSNGESLNAKILDMIIKPLWEQEPYKYLNKHTQTNTNLMCMFYNLP